MQESNTEEIRVMTHFYGPATLIRKYPHRDTKEIVWDVVTDDGERLHLSQRYVEALEAIEEAVTA